MTKHKEDEKEIELAAKQGRAASPEALSHNYQPDSPAYDLSDPAVTKNAVNTFAEEKKAEEKKPKKIVISQEEYDRRTNLDVSNYQYINPSLDHYEVK